MKIRFTVVIPVFNAEKTIYSTIVSVLNQSYKAYEIIVVNDGSTDNTEKVLREFSEAISLVSIENGGVSHARNLGISLAKGDFIAFLDSDDLWDTNHLKDLSIPLISNKEIRWACTAYDVINEQCNSRISINNVRNSTVNYFHFAHKLDFIWTGCVAISKEVLVALNGFDEKFSRGEDLDLWFRIAINYPEVGYCDRCSAYYIKNSLSLTSKELDLDNYVSRVDSSIKYSINHRIEGVAKKVINKWISGVILTIARNSRFDLLPSIGKWKVVMDYSNSLKFSFISLISKLKSSQK